MTVAPLLVIMKYPLSWSLGGYFFFCACMYCATRTSNVRIAISSVSVRYTGITPSHRGSKRNVLPQIEEATATVMATP